MTDPGGPIFLVGASRSGTALMRSALNRSSSVFLAGETHYFDDLRPRLAPSASIPLDDPKRRMCEDFFLALAHRPYGHGGDPERSRLSRSQLRAAADSLSAARATGDDYFEAYCRLSRTLEDDAATSPARWGEKTPRHVFRLTDILTRYPEGRAIAMYRDPRGVAASYSRWRHQGGLSTAQDDGYMQALHDEEERAKRSYDPSIVGLLWRATVQAGSSARRQFGDSRVKMVRYEDMVKDPTGTLTGVMNWLGLPFEPRMLEVPMHNSSFTQFSKNSGVSTEPVERWRTTLPARDAAIVQLWARQGLRELGYSVDDTDLALVDRARVLGSLPVAAGRAVWANRSRAEKIPAYVWRRVRLMRAT